MQFNFFRSAEKVILIFNSQQSILITNQSCKNHWHSHLACFLLCDLRLLNEHSFEGTLGSRILWLWLNLFLSDLHLLILKININNIDP